MTEKRRPHWAISLRIDPSLRAPLQRLADEREWSVTHVIAHLLRTHPEMQRVLEQPEH